MEIRSADYCRSQASCAVPHRWRIFEPSALAEGEELGSNVLRVSQRSPANSSVGRREWNWHPTFSTSAQRYPISSRGLWLGKYSRRHGFSGSVHSRLRRRDRPDIDPKPVSNLLGHDHPTVWKCTPGLSDIGFLDHATVVLELLLGEGDSCFAAYVHREQALHVKFGNDFRITQRI